MPTPAYVIATQPIFQFYDQPQDCKGAARKLIEGGGVYLYNERHSRVQTSVSKENMKWPYAFMLRTGKKNYHLVLVDGSFDPQAA